MADRAKELADEGQKLMKAGRFKEASEVLGTAAKLLADAHGEDSIQVAATHNNLALCYFQMGALDASQLAAEEALRLAIDKSERETRRARGVLRDIRKKHDDAEEAEEKEAEAKEAAKKQEKEDRKESSKKGKADGKKKKTTSSSQRSLVDPFQILIGMPLFALILALMWWLANRIINFNNAQDQGMGDYGSMYDYE